MATCTRALQNTPEKNRRSKSSPGVTDHRSEAQQRRGGNWGTNLTRAFSTGLAEKLEEVKTTMGSFGHPAPDALTEVRKVFIKKKATPGGRRQKKKF